MGVWELLGRIISLGPKQALFVANNSQGNGRLIYEHFDEAIGKSSKSSKFYVINSSKIFPKKESDGQEVASRIELNLADAEMVTELIE